MVGVGALAIVRQAASEQASLPLQSGWASLKKAIVSHLVPACSLGCPAEAAEPPKAQWPHRNCGMELHLI